MQFWAETRTAVLDKDRSKIIGNGVKGRRKDTPVGGDAAEDHRVDPVEAERLVEIRLVKGAETPLGHVHVRIGLREQVRYLGALRPAQGVAFFLPLEDEITRKKAVHGEDDRNSMLPGKPREAVDGGHDGAAQFPDGRRMSPFQGILEHVDDDDGWFQ